MMKMEPSSFRGPLLALLSLILLGSAREGAAEGCDVMIAIDYSYSMTQLSGFDVNSDGKVRKRSFFDRIVRSYALEDTVASAQWLVAAQAAEAVRRSQNRVGIVTYADEAHVRLPLTNDFKQVFSTLVPNMYMFDGETDLREGILRSTVELLGTASSISEVRRDVTRVLVLISDLVPTRPQRVVSENLEVSVAAAKKARDAGILVHLYLIDAERSTPDAFAEAMTDSVTLIRDHQSLKSALASVPAPLARCQGSPSPQ